MELTTAIHRFNNDKWVGQVNIYVCLLLSSLHVKHLQAKDEELSSPSGDQVPLRSSAAGLNSGFSVSIESLFSISSLKSINLTVLDRYETFRCV